MSVSGIGGPRRRIGCLVSLACRYQENGTGTSAGACWCVFGGECALFSSLTLFVKKLPSSLLIISSGDLCAHAHARVLSRLGRLTKPSAL